LEPFERLYQRSIRGDANGSLAGSHGGKGTMACA
jgi:hypothetical protein